MEPIAEVRQSKKTVTLILIITAILAIASVVTGYYYFQIQDISPQDSNASNGCGCYFIAQTDSVSNCSTANPKMAYEFRSGQIGSDGKCSAQCDLTTSSKLVSTDATTLSCNVTDFPINPGCIDLSVENSQLERYANTVPSNASLNLKAKFSTPTNAQNPDQDFYSKFSFLINGEKTEIDLSKANITGEGLQKEYEVSTQLKEYASADSLTIQAFGTSTTGTDLTSDACHRVLTVSKSQTASCTVLNAEIVNDSQDVPKVNEITINTSAISNPNTLTIKFSVGTPATTLTTKNIASLITNNALVLNKAYLYKSSNFVEGKSFSVLDDESGSIAIKAVMSVNGQVISSNGCSGTYAIPAIEEDPRVPVDTDDDTTDGGSTPTETETSNFTVKKVGSLACVERVSPANTLKYTITVTNADTDTESITRIEDKLPLGFTYVNGSTYINGASKPDAGLVTVTTVGSSQQVTFNPSTDWSVDSNETITIRFSAKVGTGALSGSNLNEVVVVPVNTPKTSGSLRTSSSVIVAQSCTAPETGIFDTTVSKVVLAIFIIFIGTFLYFSQSGIFLSEKILASGPMQSVKIWKMKNDNPKKYFEEKFIRNIEKERAD